MSDHITPTVLSPKERKKKYKKTLNLPRTSFPMRANLDQNEPQSRKRWDAGDLYRRILEARREAEPFVFHDGPPYANGSIHVGHLLNKVLKDIVVRSQTALGRRCHFIPGWDCHGLPIEHKVVSQLMESGKMAKLDELPPDVRRMAIRRECHRYAAKFKKLQAEQMQRLLTLGDYDEPYLTMAPVYERSVLEVFASLVEQGLVYRDLKPVHWSVANRTALAEAELEYFERDDPSIYVHFDAADPRLLASAFGVDLAEIPSGTASFMIWTTNPWTLPANLLIAVHEEFRYSLVRFEGDERASIIAAELVDKVAGLNRRSFEVLASVPGRDLLGLGYRHPFVDLLGRLVAADYVTLEDGTGLVHTAPGHGEEDYLTGLREGEELYSPVRGDGTFDDSVPEWIRGKLVWDANGKILDRIRDSGHLFLSLDYRHPYPHDWRSKTPVIFRCTEQWFIAVDRPTAHGARSLRDLALEATGKEIVFHPAWGQNRLRGMVESRPDWCISRQRVWGLPIPAFRTSGGEVLLTTAVVKAVAEVVGREGSDAWFTAPPEELLAGYDPAADPDAPEGIEIAGLEKMYDIFDVWFESGSSWNWAMRLRDAGFPTDLYLEGSDQHRGWFQVSLLLSLGVTGHSPFRELLTHGFMVDKEGRKMSKSLGNTLEVEDLLRDFGADVCRWWVSSLAFENDFKVDLEYFELAGESYRKVRNTLRFLLSNLSDYDPAAAGEVDLAPTSLDAWALSQGAELRDKAIAAYRGYEFRRVHLLLFDFCNETLSALYLDAVKDRLYCDRPNSPRRRATQGVLRQLAELLAALLAPIMPHTADEAWRSLAGNEEGSVHLEVVPEIEAAADDRWPEVIAAREVARKALEGAKADGIDNPLDAGLVMGDPRGVLAAFEADLAEVMGVSRVSLTADGEVTVEDLREEPRCERSWRRDGTVRERADGGWLSDRNAEAVGLG